MSLRKVISAVLYLVLCSTFVSGCYEEGNPRANAYVPKTHALEQHQKAVRALRNGALEEALRFADEAADFDPGYGAAQDTRAKVLARLKRYEEAADAAAAAVGLEPERAAGHIFHGVCLELAGSPKEAKVAYEAALDLYEALRGDKALAPEDAVNQVIALYLSRGMLVANPVIHVVLEQYPNHAGAQLVRDRVVENDRARFLEALVTPPAETPKSN